MSVAIGTDQPPSTGAPRLSWRARLMHWVRSGFAEAETPDEGACMWCDVTDQVVNSSVPALRSENVVGGALVA